MAAPQAESSVLATPPPPNRLKQRGPPETVLASPFTTFLKHLPDLTPPRATTYNSYSSFAFTVQSPAPARLASSHQTPAKSRSGDQDQDGAPFANILAMADLKATPVKAEPDQDGLGFRGNGSETPYGLRSPIPLFHQSPRRPGISGSPTPGSKLTGGPASELRGSTLPAGIGSPNLISSAFAALLEGHSRSSPGGALSILGAPGNSAAGAGAGPGSASRSFSGLFSPAKAAPASAGAGSGSERGSGSGEESGGGAASGSAGAAERLRGTAAVAAAAAAAAASGEQRAGGSDADGPAGEPSRGGGVSSGGEGALGGGGGVGSSRGMPPLPPFFSPLGGGGVTPGSAGIGLHRGGSFRSVSGHGGASTADDTAGESGSDVEGVRMGEDDAADDDDDYTEEGRRNRARCAARRSMPPAESPRMVRQRPGSVGLGPGSGAGSGSYGRLPAGRYGAGASRRAAGSSADSLANADFATDDDAEPTPLVHAMLPQSPMCVPLNLDTFLPIPKLRSDDRAGSGGAGSPTQRPIGIRPAPIDSPAVKAATNAAITAALEAAVGPASSSGASGSMRSTRGRGGEGDRGAAGAARAAAAAAAAGGSAPLTRRQSSSASARNKASFLPAPTSDEALVARMKLQSNKKCNCKKSKCLKLYCDCFAGGGFCGPQCSCAGCSNRQDNLEVVKAAREQIASRNPNAFKEKIEADPSLGGQHRRGCNCKKSHCMKKYCECFSAGVPCGEHCKCDGCHNGPDQFKRQPPSGRGRRSAAAAAAGSTAVPPLPPVATAMRAGAIPILIPTAAAAGQRGMQVAAGAAGGSGAAAAGEAGMSSDAAATLALGNALGSTLQFLLPMAQQQQQQQAAAAAAAGDESGTPRAAQGDATATPSPSLAPPAASSPQVLQIFSMMQPPVSAPAGGASSAAAGVGAASAPASSSQFLVPLMWPFANGATGQQLPLSLPPEVQGDPAAAMKLLQQMTAAQQLPAAPEQQQQQQRHGSPVPFPCLAPAQAAQTQPAATAATARAAAAAVSSPTVLTASEQGLDSPLSASSPALALAETLQSPGVAALGAAGGALGGAAPCSPSFSFQLQPLAEAAGGGTSPQPLPPPHPPAAAAAAAAAANGAGAAATPAALADMDVVLDSPRGEAVAVMAAAAAPGSWLRLNAIGGSGALQQQQQGAGAAGEGPALGLSSHAGLAQGALQQQQGEVQGVPTRKRTRGGSRAGTGSGDQLVHLQQQQQQQAGASLGQHAPPASPRATPTKRKPLRTITSALM